MEQAAGSERSDTEAAEPLAEGAEHLAPPGSTRGGSGQTSAAMRRSESTPGLDSDSVPFVTQGPPKPGARAPTVAEDIIAISRLKFRHIRAMDTKNWDELAETMLPDATAIYGEYLEFDSRAEFLNFVRTTLGPHTITEHRVDHPEIDVTGDDATGTWYVGYTMLVPERQVLVRDSAFYTDRYRRAPEGTWRIAHTDYRRTYEIEFSLTDLPSFKLTANQAVGPAAGLRDTAPNSPTDR